ncbi:hypothetical protein [Paraburkholderia gardini]|uniref:Uncharacterized protein n=1 Tax=Paraburkholderia gardini TaxID=2823469 RepID=A0ABN7QMV2_9BURK|nr:hypothetical protein [Paraburkholderia gardini]CAG4902526.1 hypothetical protein R69919_02954 [Paraburkholderia gardini]CAG4910663.1 hypothetical protein R54767_03717 [Paraburkholderia gardini]
MQARKSISLLVLPVVMATTAFAAQADETPLPPPAAQAAATGEGPPGSAAVSGTVTPATVSAAPASASVLSDSFGVAMTAGQLDEHRGGDALIGQNYLTGSLTNTSAYKVETGSNSISEGSFASSSGLPTVIQNTGANVLIQNATVLNVRFGN